MIDVSNLTCTWIRTNTKAGMETTGVVAALTLCFQTEPEESRVTVWYAKNGAGKPEFMTPTIPVERPAGVSSSQQPCLYGGLSKELVRLASEAHDRLKKAIKPEFGKLYKVGPDKVEEIP